MILRRRPRARGEERSLSWQGLQAMIVSGGAGAGSIDQAMRHDAVWAAANRIAKDVAMMPVDEIRSTGGRRDRLDPSPLIAEPSAHISALDWRYQVLLSWQLRGQAYGWVTEVDRLQYPTKIEVVSPDAVSWTSDRQLRVDGKTVRPWPLGDMWTAPAYTLPGSHQGLSPIEMHSTTIATGLRTMAFARQFFEDGAHPTGIITVAGNPSQEQRDDLFAKFREKTRGNREPIVLPKDTTWTPLTVKPEETLYVDLLRLTTEQIARIFGVFPEMIGGSVGGGSLTYASREQNAQHHITWSLQFWMTKLDGCLTSLLPRGRGAKTNPAATLRGDLPTRYASYKTAAEIGQLTGETLLSVAEMRELEDRPPLEATT